MDRRRFVLSIGGAVVGATGARSQQLAEAGALMSYGPRLVDDLRRLPYYIDRILKGAKPA